MVTCPPHNYFFSPLQGTLVCEKCGYRLLTEMTNVIDLMNKRTGEVVLRPSTVPGAPQRKECVCSPQEKRRGYYHSVVLNCYVCMDCDGVMGMAAPVRAQPKTMDQQQHLLPPLPSEKTMSENATTSTPTPTPTPQPAKQEIKYLCRKHIAPYTRKAAEAIINDKIFTEDEVADAYDKILADEKTPYLGPVALLHYLFHSVPKEKMSDFLKIWDDIHKELIWDGKMTLDSIYRKGYNVTSAADVREYAIRAASAKNAKS